MDKMNKGFKKKSTSQSLSSSNTLTSLSPYAAALKVKLDLFLKNHCIPAEVEYEKHMSTRSGADRWTIDAVPPCMERLKLGTFYKYML